MANLLIEKSIDIGASQENVWNVLTDLGLAKKWLSVFHEGTSVETDWNVGSYVVWKDGEGDVGATGKVAVYERNRLLLIEYPEEDNPNDNPDESWAEYAESFEVSEGDGNTSLFVKVGPIPEAHHAMHLPYWEDAVKKIKELSESL